VSLAVQALSTLARRDMPPNYRFSMTEDAFEFVPAGTAAKSGLLFMCDHASNALPAAYGDLGLDPALLSTHIASDIGAAEATRTLAAHFGAPAVLARWSRLLIDLNRGEDDPTLVMKLSDGSIIPGNRSVDAAEIASRIARFHAPYHARIAEEISKLGPVPVLISMHSFTPAWKGRARPWQVGENDCLYRHGTMNGLPHVLIEIRQDLIADAAAARAFAMRLAPVIEAALVEMGPPQIAFTRPAITAASQKTHN
jgi:predicted N-formylglutamate amidohydrolase